MRFFIVSPAHIATGGTELLHQFSKMLSDNSIENYMVYINSDGKHCPTPDIFKKYDVKCAGSYADAKDAVLVLPEGWIHLLDELGCIKGIVMIWWLSVDNYLLAYNHLFTDNDPDVFQLKFRENIVHFVQSQYAKKFLQEQMGIEESYFLMDYINDDIVKTASLYQKMKYERKNICLYNPRKGYETLKPVIEACREDIVWMPLNGYKPEEMAALMCMSKVYVDFGNHPGKDGIPREAAICGCCIVTNRKGSAAYQEDVDIPECYKIADTGDINSVLEIIYTLVDHYEEKREVFSGYREKIAKEKNEFIKDFQNAISILEGCVKKTKSLKIKPYTCRICGAEGDFDTYLARDRITGRSFPYFVCDRCQCLQIADVPENLEEYYEKRNCTARTAGDLGTKFDTPVIHTEKVLDVGCGSGDWLSKLAQAGWGNLYGCEPFLEKDCQYGSRVTIRKCTIHEIEGEGTFDVINMKDSFEHVPDPLEVLQSAWRLLKPGGILYMTIPTYPNMAFERFGVYWYQMDAPRHVFLHSRKSLEYLSRASGMAISGIQYDSNYDQIIQSFFDQHRIHHDGRSAGLVSQYFDKEDIQRLQIQANLWNEKECGDHMLVTWRKSTIPAVRDGRKVIFQRFSDNGGRRRFPYPPLYREPDTDYICFTEDEKVSSSVWKIQVVENLEQTDLEPYLEQYAVRWELRQEQIQMGSIAEVYAGENVVTVPKLEELPLVKFEVEKLVPTADEEGRYIYRKNPVYKDGKYNGRSLLLTIGVPVSNQIGTIERCLSHIKPLLEQLDAELLVIDTGSTDGTVEVCRQYGARIISYPWCGNMSAVRNEGIYQAKGEWYMSIDDDEWFEDVEDILDFFKKGIYRNCDKASYIQRNYADSAGTVYEDYHTPRMARITPGLHFEGRIHDALVMEDVFNRVGVLHSYAHHYGFVNDRPEGKQEKFIRNAHILLQDIYEYPKEFRYLFQLANEYRCVGYGDIAVKLFAQVIALAKESNETTWGKNGVVMLCACMSDLRDKRMFSWMKNMEDTFPLMVSEQAFIAWCQQSLAFQVGKAPEQVLEYYCQYESRLMEYRKEPAESQYHAFYGLETLEHELYIMDAEAVAFCSYLSVDNEEKALEVLTHISLDVVKERRAAILTEGLAAGDRVYEALCDKLTVMQWGEWSKEILDAFVIGLGRNSTYKRQLERLPSLLSRLSVPAIISWFEQAKERRSGRVGARLYEYAKSCGVEESVQKLCLCAWVLKEAYVMKRNAEDGKETLFSYILTMGAFAEQYYNLELLTDPNCRAVPPDICAAYRMAVVLADGRPSHENVELLKQALAIFPAFHEEIRGILTELSTSGG